MRTNQVTMQRSKKKRGWFRLWPLALAIGCIPATQPCSSAELAEKLAVCVARERIECKPDAAGKKDPTCPAYLECKETVDSWEACQ